jgi:hypothetical protein
MQVDLAVLYSERPAVLAQLDVAPRPTKVRLGRAGLTLLALLAGGAVVTVLPLLHLCGAALLLLGAPIATWLAWKPSVVTLGAQQLACPKCARPVVVADGRLGWPIRLQCDGCGASLSARAHRGD